ncbi:MAG: major facilitator superfamily protein [Betaproteobacteria bacterium]|nr:major facilitator superfamily protein [Betaproteobacteria bacterium]
MRYFSSVRFLPPGVLPDARLLLWARGLRAFGDGYVSLLLPYYLILLGYDAFKIGVIVTGTLLGSGATTLCLGFIAHDFRQRRLLEFAALLMMATGVAFVLSPDFWPLLLIAVVGTMNPSSGDVSLFGPIEHAMLTRTVDAEHRTALFGRYALTGALVGALGAQAAAMPTLAHEWLQMDTKLAVQLMFLAYGAIGFICLLLYRRLSPAVEPHVSTPSIPLGKSRRTVFTLAAVFSLDAFAGGLAVQSLLALWLFDRFDLSVATAGTIFLWTGILAAFSQLAAASLARRFGLINTMVFTHLPSNIFLILVPFMPTLTLALTFLMLRSALSSMDVPARTSYVMAVVTPGERAAAASVTAVPRSLAAAVSPMLAGWMLTVSPFGWPLVVCGGLKIVYDLILLAMFRHVRPPEEIKNAEEKS